MTFALPTPTAQSNNETTKTALVTEYTRQKTALGSTPVATVTFNEYSTGRDVVTVLTLTDFIIGAFTPAAAALAFGNILYTYPAGQHLELVYGFSSVNLKAAGTAVATNVALGSVVGAGAVATLAGTATFMDRITQQSITTSSTGGTAASALLAATAGIGTGISLNVAASVKNVFMNAAGTWNLNNTGNLTASGVVTLKWTYMS